MNGVSFSTKALQSAMGQYGISEESLAVSFPKIKAWLMGEMKPTLKQLGLLAKAVYIPLGFLFLPELPVIALPPTLYRTSDRSIGGAFSPELYDTVSTMISRQTWLREYLKDNGYPELAFVGSARTYDDPIDIAHSMRKTLGIAINWAHSQSTWDSTLDILRSHIENSGIFVVSNSVVDNNTHRSLAIKEFRGFALVDRIAPFLFINSADAKSAQMFTLAHELAHVWLGDSALFDIDPMLPAANYIEIFCDKVAAEFLIPQEHILSEWSQLKGESQVIYTIAQKYKVSEIVVARRLLDCNCIDKKQFFEFYNSYNERLSSIPKKKGSGGDFYKTQNKRVGQRFMKMISYAVAEGSLPYTDAFKLTGLHGKTFYNYEDRVTLR